MKMIAQKVQVNTVNEKRVSQVKSGALEHSFVKIFTRTFISWLLELIGKIFLNFSKQIGTPLFIPK